MVTSVTKASLDGLIGKTIADFCPVGFTDSRLNHCAHFVSHVLGLRYGTICSKLITPPVGVAVAAGASVRCNELYNALSQRGPWADALKNTDGLLLFVTLTSNVTGGQMRDNSHKHVGIVFGGAVYNYGNQDDKVRREPSAAAFKTRLGKIYGGEDKVSLFYAVPQ